MEELDTTTLQPSIHLSRESANLAAFDLAVRHVARRNPAGRLSAAEHVDQVELVASLRRHLESMDGQKGGLF